MSDMTYRRVGDSGLKVSVVGLGCNNFGGRTDEAASRRVIDAALDCGVNFFDTADVYGGGESERIIGAALRGRRDQVIIATKFGGSTGDSSYDRGASRRYVRRAIEASLRRLATDYVDLYQLHWPDPETPVRETLSALNGLIVEGKVRYIGCSNFAGWQIAEAEWVARANGWERFISVQNEYSLINRDVEKEVIPVCRQYGIGVLPYFPLAAGLLTGKYRRGQPAPPGTRLAGSPRAARWMNEANFDAVERLERFAADRGISLLDVAIGGMAAKPQIASVIAGATKPEQIEANVRAGMWQPSVQDMEEIDRITGGVDD